MKSGRDPVALVEPERSQVGGAAADLDAKLVETEDQVRPRTLPVYECEAPVVHAFAGGDRVNHSNHGRPV